MKIRVKVSKDVTREQLIERIPDLIKSAVDTVLEKGIPLHGDALRSHPVKAIAVQEDDIFEQGSEALSGIQAWLSKKLFGKSLQKSETDKDDYRAHMLESHGIHLGGQVTSEQAQEIEEVLKLVPDDAFGDKLKTISVDGRFGAPKRKYPNHGRYYEEDRRIVLNPHIFGDKTDYRDDDGGPITKIQHTLLHELGHTIDDRYGLSDKKEWRGISEWTYIGKENPKEGHERLEIDDNGSGSLKGKWSYKVGTNFPRWYGARNPKEDFCECFVFALLGAEDRFEDESGKRKLAFVKKVIEKLIKSDNPGLGMVADDELCKSQEFVAYCDLRLPSLSHMDDIEAFELAKSEFAREDCDGLGYEFEKAGIGNSSPGTGVPKPGASQAKAAGSGAPGAGGPSPLKGQMKPGHKYLYRETKADGTYRYWYKLPDGRIYNSDKARHDEGVHRPEANTDTEWGRMAAELGINLKGMEDVEAAGGQNAFQIPEGEQAKVGDFEMPKDSEVPHLINDEVKPNAATFDPNATPEEKEKAEEEQKKDDEKKGILKKPKREVKDFQLLVDQEKEIEAALRTWEIEKWDESFGESGINVSMKVKLKNDGWAMLKPRVGSKALASTQNNIRRDMDEKSTIFREALAYALDKALKWHLVPPTIVRRVKGAGNRRLVEAVKKKISEMKNKGHATNAAAEKAIKEFSEQEDNFASLQFFANGGRSVASAKSEDLAYIRSGMPEEECMRMALFDMIIDHQDRHLHNILIAEDKDSENRYGGNRRFVVIDNGYCAGNGYKINRRLYSDFLEGRTKDRFISKKTLRDLRELRKDIMDPRRRRKLLTKDIRENVPSDQLLRIAKRIDFILGEKFRDKLGRVKMTTWDELTNWERKEHPPKHMGEPAIPNAFDLTGKTALIDKKMQIPAFKNARAIQDFFAPLRPHMEPNQIKMLDELVDAYSGHKKVKDVQGMAENLKNFFRECPKKLVHQLFENQRIMDRMGMMKSPDEQYYADDVKKWVKKYVDRDFVEELYAHLAKHGKPGDVDRLKRGEMKQEDLKKVLGHIYDRYLARGAVPKEARPEGQQSKTSAIFENPEKFAWPASGPKGEMVELSMGPSLIVRLEK